MKKEAGKNEGGVSLYSNHKLNSKITYKILFEDSGTSIIIIDIEGIYLFVNSKAANMMGYSAKEIVGKSMFEFLPKETAEKYLLRNRQFIQKGTSEEYEDTFDLPSGTRTFLITDKVLKDRDGRGYALQSSSIDITDHKKAEEAILESEEMYRLIAQNLPGTTVLLYDTDLRYLLVEGYLHPDFGFNTNQLKGKTLWEVVPPERAEKLAYIYQEALNGRASENFISEFKGHFFSVNVVPIYNMQGVIRHGLVVSQDITERKMAEKMLQENESRLRELNATKDKFFSIIAHDLKSPFNGILGLSQYLVEQIEAKRYEEVEEYVKIIRDSSLRVMELLSNLLEWSRTQDGRMDFKLERTQIIELINNEIYLLNDSFRQKSISVITELPERIYVFVDSAMFSTIIRNLISNAIKFTNPDGEVKVSLEEKDDLIKISVKDNGVGIKKERVEKLFHIDENQSTSGTWNEKGTGLGLILCKEFVEKHGGEISIKSEYGKGSTFSFTIPKKEI